MKRAIISAGVLSVGLMFLASAAHAAGIKEGEWSMTTAIHMDGMGDEMAKSQKEMENMSPEDKAMMQQMMGGMNIGGPGGGMGMSTTTSQCITNDNPVPEANNQEGCTRTHDMSGNKVHFEVTCANSHSIGDVTYKNESMKGSIVSTQTENGQEVKSTIDISGEFVGPCALNSEAVTARATHPSAQGVRRTGISNQENEQEDESAESNSGDNPSTAKKVFGGLKTIFGR